jgi:hypothetical protein
MDNPKSLDKMHAALTLHRAAEVNLKTSRQKLNEQAFDESGLAKGDIVSFADSYYGDISAEVKDVFLVYNIPWNKDHEPETLVKVSGYKLTKAGKRYIGSKTVSTFLSKVTLVRKAGE